MSSHVFNSRRFAADLEVIRDQRRVSWRQVAKETGITPSTLTRIQQGRNPDANAMVALLLWMDRPIERYARRTDDIANGVPAMRPSEV